MALVGNFHAEVITVRRRVLEKNGLHWVLNAIFREDDSQLKDRTAAENLGLLRHVVASLLRQDRSKGSISGKLLHAASADEFRLHLLALLSGESA